MVSFLSYLLTTSTHSIIFYSVFLSLVGQRIWFSQSLLNSHPSQNLFNTPSCPTFIFTQGNAKKRNRWVASGIWRARVRKRKGKGANGSKSFESRRRFSWSTWQCGRSS